MKHPKLIVEERKIFGKKIKALRKNDILPGNIYGKDIKSTAVQVAKKDFDKVYKEVGETGLVDLQLKDKILPVLIHNIASDYKRNILHADFYKVDLKEKVKAMIPIVLTGEAKAVTEKIGILMQVLAEVEVEALPEALPENIELNVENLAEINQQLTVSELKTIEGVEVLTDPTQVVVKIAELVSKEAQEQAAEEAAKAEEAKAETAEGEAKEGEAGEQKEEQTEAEKPQNEEKES